MHCGRDQYPVDSDSTCTSLNTDVALRPPKTMSESAKSQTALCPCRQSGRSCNEVLRHVISGPGESAWCLYKRQAGSAMFAMKVMAVIADVTAIYAPSRAFVLHHLAALPQIKTCKNCLKRCIELGGYNLRLLHMPFTFCSKIDMHEHMTMSVLAHVLTPFVSTCAQVTVSGSRLYTALLGLFPCPPNR